MIMREQIQQQIDSAREELHDLEIQRARIDERIKTLEEMLLLTPDEVPKRRATRKRALSDHWQNVLYLMLTEKPDGASYDEIYNMVERVGISMKKSNLRGHMGNYKASGYVKAVRDGVFVLTPEGKKQTKEFKEEEPDAITSGSHELGADTGRGDGYPPDNPSGSIPDASTDTPPWRRSEIDDDEIPF